MLKMCKTECDNLAFFSHTTQKRCKVCVKFELRFFRNFTGCFGWKVGFGKKICKCLHIFYIFSEITYTLLNLIFLYNPYTWDKTITWGTRVQNMIFKICYRFSFMKHILWIQCHQNYVYCCRLKCLKAL